jgi:hypothetical protein
MDDSAVPREIEDYLIARSARAGQIGGSIGGAIAGGAAGAAGARGGARGAARLKTRVERRSGTVPGTAEEAVGRLLAEFPKARRLPADGSIRLAVPLGITGLQQIVLDTELEPADNGATTARLRGFGKESVLSRKPTRAVTDRAWAALAAG